MAQWSTKKEQEKLHIRQEQIFAAKKELAIRASRAINLLVKNGWKAEQIEEGVYNVKMPGAYPTTVRGIESLERKTLGMQ